VWNVRGLNGRARRNVVREFLVQHRATVVCLQETKVSVGYKHLGTLDSRRCSAETLAILVTKLVFM
jgi:exonuclease III